MKQKTVKLIGGVLLLSTIPLVGTFGIQQKNSDNNQNLVTTDFLNEDDKIINLEAGTNFSGALIEKSDKTQELWMWGHNQNGELGNGSYENSKVPVQVDTSKMLNDENDHIVDFVTSDYKNSIALVDSNGTQEVWMWGNNTWGQLGNGTYENSNIPIKVDTSKMLNESSDQIVDISLSDEYAGAIVANEEYNHQEVWMWGNNNYYYQLEDGSYDSSSLPTKTDTYPMINQAGDKIVDLKTSHSGTALMIENPDGSQEIWRWGYKHHEDGTGYSDGNPIKVDLSKLLSEPKDSIIDFGLYWALIQKYNGGQEIWTYGANGYGQLGDGTFIDSWIDPIKVDTTFMFESNEDRIIAVKSNGFSFSALVQKETGNQELWAWGKNTYGQLGIGTNQNSNLPIKVNTAKMLNESSDWIVDYSLGKTHTSAIVQNANGSQEVWMWGDNVGQFGNNTSGNSVNVPMMTIDNNQENDLYWATSVTYNSSINKIYGEFELKNYSDNVKIIQQNLDNTQAIFAMPQYDFNTEKYSFMVDPIINSDSPYYYEFEQFKIQADGITLDNQNILINNFDPSSIILNANVDYVTHDLAIISFTTNEKLLTWIEINNFKIKMEINGNTSILSYEDIKSNDIALLNLTSKTDYNVNFYVEDNYNNNYLNTSVSFVTN